MRAGVSVFVPVRLSCNLEYVEEYGLDLKPVKVTKNYVIYTGKHITVIVYVLHRGVNEPAVTIPLPYFPYKQLCERIAEYFLLEFWIALLEDELCIIQSKLEWEIDEYNERTEPAVIQEIIEEMHEIIKVLRKLRNRMKELNIIKIKETYKYDGGLYYEVHLVVRC